MIPVIKVAAVLVMIALLVFSLKKKLNVLTTMFWMGLIVLGIVTICTGVSVLGENTTGSKFIDLFESVANTFSTTLTGTGLPLMSVMAYVAYMEHLKASQLFSVLITKPVKKAKRVEILIAAVIGITYLLKLVVPSGIAVIALVVAILYPVMRACGLSRPTCASTVVLGAGGCWNVTGAVPAFTAANITHISAVDYFMTKQVPMTIVIWAVTSVLAIIFSKIWDRKEGIVIDREALAAAEEQHFDIPKFYAALPLLPIVIIILFCGKILPITISVTAANFMAFFIAFLINFICAKDKMEAYSGTKEWFKGMGNFVVNALSIIIASSVFASAVKAVGGMNVIFDLFSQSASGVYVVGAIGAILACIIVVATGSIMATLPMFYNLYGTMCGGTDFILLYRQMEASATLGSTLCPITAVMVFVSGETQVPVNVIIKRNLIPTLAALVVSIVFPILFP